MARYAIGDIQGCFIQFQQLINKIEFNLSKDILYLVGDLVNRGPQSLEVLKWLYKNQDSVINVLGNHDIYLIARYNHLVKIESQDTLNETLQYKHIGKIIDWLRASPVIFHDNDYIMAHAGIYPNMDFNGALHLNYKIMRNLLSSKYSEFISAIYGNKPNSWEENFSELNQMKFLINACTRMRFLDTSGDLALDYKFKGDMNSKPDNLIPWFRAPLHPSINKRIIFGHWAALGLMQEEKFLAIDTGCVWGRILTAVNLENQQIFQV